MDCIIKRGNIWLTRCTDMPQIPLSMITVPDNFSATPEEAIDPEFWQGKLLAGVAERIYLWPYFVLVEPNHKEAAYEDTAHALLLAHGGNYRWRFHFNNGLCLHKKMFTHRSNSGRAFIYDVEEQLLGTELPSGNVTGLAIQLLNLEKLRFADGTVATTSPLMLALANYKELDERGVLLKNAPHVVKLQPL